MCTKPHVAADTVGWWAQVESNHRPHAYQACALTFWAMSPFVSQPSITLAFASLPSLSYPLGRRYYRLVEMKGIEPLTPCLQGRCSPSWATPPYSWDFLTVPENRTTNRSYETLSRRFCFLCELREILFQFLLFSIERRWSSRTFRYGYLVTT